MLSRGGRMDKVTKVNSLEKKEGQGVIPSKFLYVPLLISLTIAPALAAGNKANTNHQNKKEEQSSKIYAPEALKRDLIPWIETTGTKVSQETANAIAKCLQKYEKDGKTANIIENWLPYISLGTKSDKALLESANCISKFEKTPETASAIAGGLGRIAFAVKTEGAVTDSVNCISKYEKTPGVAFELSFLLTVVATNRHSEKAVSDTAKWMSSDTVFNCLSKYEKDPETADVIVRALGSVAYKMGSEGAVLDLAKKISEAKTPEKAAKIANKAIKKLPKD